MPRELKVCSHTINGQNGQHTAVVCVVEKDDQGNETVGPEVTLMIDAIALDRDYDGDPEKWMTQKHADRMDRMFDQFKASKSGGPKNLAEKRIAMPAPGKGK